MTSNIGDFAIVQAGLEIFVVPYMWIFYKNQVINIFKMVLIILYTLITLITITTII